MIGKDKEKQSLDWIFALTILVNILIPKAGIKLAGIPITLGNVLFLILLVDWIVRKGIIVTNQLSHMLLIMIGYWIIVLGYIFINHQRGLGEVLGFVIPLAVFPWIYFMYPVYCDTEKKKWTVLYIIKWSVLIALGYGMLQLFFGVEPIAIPGITVNWGDYILSPDHWTAYKYNSLDSGEATKVVSTYQNGNLFGANMILFVPLILEMPVKKYWMKYVLLLYMLGALFLTGSRTIYVGIAVVVVYLVWRQITKMHLQVRTLVGGGIVLLGIIGVIAKLAGEGSAYAVRMASFLDVNKFLEGNNRVPGATTFVYWLTKYGSIWNKLFGSYGVNYQGTASEMTFVCLLLVGGIVGLVLWSFIYFANIMVCWRRIKIVPMNDKKNRKIMTGLVASGVIYAIVACIDGGAWLTPTMINVWLLLSMGYYWEKKQNGKNN